MVSGRQTPDWVKEAYYVLRHNPFFVFIFGITVAALLQFLFNFSGAGTVLGISILILVIYGTYLLRKDRGDKVRKLTVQPKQGLAVIASFDDLESSAAMAAIKYHFRGENDDRDEPTLKHLWIIHSKKFNKPPKREEDQACKPKGPPKLPSFELAQELKTYWEERLSPENVVLLEITDPDNPYEVFEKALTIYARARMVFQISPNDIVADVTGGTKSMSIGLALACLPQARNLQFMKPREYNEQGRPVVSKGSVPEPIDINWVERRGHVADSG